MKLTEAEFERLIQSAYPKSPWPIPNQAVKRSIEGVYGGKHYEHVFGVHPKGHDNHWEVIPIIYGFISMIKDLSDMHDTWNSKDPSAEFLEAAEPLLRKAGLESDDARRIALELAQLMRAKA